MIIIYYNNIHDAINKPTHPSQNGEENAARAAFIALISRETSGPHQPAR